MKTQLQNRINDYLRTAAFRVAIGDALRSLPRGILIGALFGAAATLIGLEPIALLIGGVGGGACAFLLRYALSHRAASTTFRSSLLKRLDSAAGAKDAILTVDQGVEGPFAPVVERQASLATTPEAVTHALPLVGHRLLLPSLLLLAVLIGLVVAWHPLVPALIAPAEVASEPSASADAAEQETKQILEDIRQKKEEESRNKEDKDSQGAGASKTGNADNTPSGTEGEERRKTPGGAVPVGSDTRAQESEMVRNRPRQAWEEPDQQEKKDAKASDEGKDPYEVRPPRRGQVGKRERNRLPKAAKRDKPASKHKTMAINPSFNDGDKKAIRARKDVYDPSGRSRDLEPSASGVPDQVADPDRAQVASGGLSDEERAWASRWEKIYSRSR